MECIKTEIKNGVDLHTIKTSKFKTNLIAVMLTNKITKENATKNALLSLILRRGTANIKTQDEISKKLENMYGANFDCGIDKIGDNQVLKFYLESLNNEYLPVEEDNLKESIEILLDIVCNPLVEENKFKQEYFEAEKEKLKQIIEAKKDNKGMYAFNRCIEEMYKNSPYGIYKFGSIEELEKITNEELYKYYMEFIQKCKIDIYISGKISEEARKYIINNNNILKLKERKPEYIENSLENITEVKEKVIEESAEITQGKLVIGMNVETNGENSKNIALIYNAILGGTATSKLFQNVREKASLAYTASSNYIRQKNSIFIRCGIEIENYEKALKIIKEQIEDMKQGNFTEEELENTKQYIISAIEAIEDEQDTQIAYSFSHEISKTSDSINEYKKGVELVTKQQVIDLANTIKINTIYFLKN